MLLSVYFGSSEHKLSNMNLSLKFFIAVYALLSLFFSGILPIQAGDPTPPASPLDTYWNGAGDTPGMTYYRQSGGYLRFTQYPVRVYLLAGDAWQSVLETALQQLQTVLPVQQTSNLFEADIFIQLLSDERFENQTGCDVQHEDACSVMLPIGNPDSHHFRVLSRIWIRRNTGLPPLHVMLHELLHALGLLIHSPYPDDVLYNGSDAASIALSSRDRATLEFLYTQPAIGE